jgi:hypothetical protein
MAILVPQLLLLAIALVIFGMLRTIVFWSYPG